MRQNDERTCCPTLQTMLADHWRLTRDVALLIELEDADAQSRLTRHFRRDGTGKDFLGSIRSISSAYHITPDDGTRGSQAWLALQHVACVVQEDLLSIAVYARRLESENELLHQQVRQLRE